MSEITVKILDSLGSPIAAVLLDKSLTAEELIQDLIFNGLLRPPEEGFEHQVALGKATRMPWHATFAEFGVEDRATLQIVGPLR